ncbi:MAG: lipocalin family protein [Bacteroidales bacterium]|nr:lipocalin family protein [Bacteroidales bacterium]MEE1118786.1 lipocalin family protein [Bacteroidales bacterium]
MKRFFKNAIASGLLMFVVASCSSNKSVQSVDNSTIKQLDVTRYMGQWYEIARYDHSFEKGMTHVKANYRLLSNGKIEVTNSGMKDGKFKVKKGKARQVSIKDPGKLEVSFFLWFYSDYYIMELDKNYNYVVVGSSSDKYLWILSRTPQLDEDIKQSLLSKISERGYDTTALYFVPQ